VVQCAKSVVGRCKGALSSRSSWSKSATGAKSRAARAEGLALSPACIFKPDSVNTPWATSDIELFY
jgi:hypothetical protein